VSLSQILATHPHVLLDFDGPVCAVFGGIPADHVARHLASLLRAHGVPLPRAVDAAADPFDVFRAAARTQPASAQYAENTLRDLEVHAVATATLTPGIENALRALRATSHTVTIVSNNSAAAVRAFLDLHALVPLVRGVVGRVEPDPALLKPSPHLVQRAIADLAAAPDTCVLLGDSATDITAARTAGTAAIGYANKPGKRDAFAALAPDDVIADLAEVTSALDRQTAL
jgi:HAD superfamily hydrolase (TIGR01509 family)